MAGGNRGDDWNVGRELVQLQREMNRLAQRALRPTVRRGARVFPSLIISASDDRLVVRAEVPGMELENFEISVTGDTLTVQGSRITGEGLEEDWYHRQERQSGDFGRTVRLPAEVDGNQAEASYVAGVLTISLPLKEAAKPRQIPVKVVEG